MVSCATNCQFALYLGMQITIATLYLPYPDVPHGGGQDLFHLIRKLGQRHTIRVVSFVDAAQAAHADALRPFVADLRLVTPAISLGEKWQNVIAALKKGQWQSMGRRADSEMRQAIAGWPTDILHCAWTEMGRYLAAAPPGAVRVLDEVDVRFLVEQAAGSNNQRTIQRQRQELAYCRTADLILTRSARDLAALQEKIPGLNGLILPPVAHVTDYAAIHPEESKPGRVLFVGNMSRTRNQTAVSWLVETIWPLVRAACPEATLHIVGADPPKAIVALGPIPGITVTGWVADLRAEYAQAHVIVAPMRSEAGALNKVLDGMAAGRPVVATTVANAGIAAPSEAIALADEASTFAQAIINFLRNEADWQRQGQAGRRFVLANFDWETAVQRYEQTLLELVKGGQCAR
jgi:glycosyltransferase involved in cell wall biosynthesis